MPVTIAYGLAVVPPVSGPGFVVPVFPNSGSGLVCDVQPFDQQHFLDLYDRIFPEEYISPLKVNPNSGYELLQAFASIGARVSTAINRFECGLFIIYATGGVATEIDLTFSRPNASAGAVTIQAGTRFVTSTNGRGFVLTADVSFGASDVGPITGRARADAVGYEYNVPGEVVTSSGIVLEGEVDTAESWRLEPAYGDPTLQVSQIQAPAVIGKCADLDALGSNRGVERVSGEADDPYRLRIQNLPDVVSPAAMRRTVERQLSGTRVEVPFAFCETFEHTYQEVYDAPSTNSGTPSFQPVPPTNPDFNTATFVYDDPRAVTTVNDFCRNRLLDIVEARGAFVVVLPNNVTLIDTGLAYDDPGNGPADFLNPSTGVRRGTPAFDITNDDNATIMTAAFDGFDIERGSLYAGIAADLNAVKPAGVAAIIETIRP